MKNEQIRQLIEQITELENELQTTIQEQQSKMFFQIKGKRVEFEHTIKLTHRKLKKGLFRWLTEDRPQNLITGPIIYSMFFPLLFVDLCISFFQATCFPIYKIKKVRRSDYIVIDRQHLEYLNWFQRFHCTYCAYGTGLIAYVSEIISRTEQYFCPIKHARKIIGTHARYRHFLDYGDGDEYEKKLEQFRQELAEKEVAFKQSDE
jgi:hypothetical protein